MRTRDKHATQLAFAEALHNLVAQKPIDKITVGEICASAHRSPATFYRYFCDKYELAVWDYARAPREILLRFSISTGERPLMGTGSRPVEGSSPYTYLWHDAIRDSLAYHWAHREYLQNLLVHTSGRDSFALHMAAADIALLTDTVERVTGSMPSEDLILGIRVYCHGLIQLVCEWIMGEFSCDSIRLAQIMEDCVPLLLRPILVPEASSGT